MSTNQADEIKDLGRRAVACKHWRWMAGMLAVPHGRVDAGQAVTQPAWNNRNTPDFTDPATIGCLIALVEEAYGFPVCAYSPRIDRSGWLVESAHDNGQSLATSNIESSRAAALVAVLEAAP